MFLGDCTRLPRRWYRERAGRLEAVRAARDAWLWAEGAALCFERVARDKAGGWLCKAYNALGDATAHTRLVVDDLFAVTLEPRVAVRLSFIYSFCFLLQARRRIKIYKKSTYRKIFRNRPTYRKINI